MTSDRRYFFAAPDDNNASGGREYLYTAVRILCDLGYDARALHSRPDYSYTWFENDVPVDFIPPRAVLRGIPEYYRLDALKYVRRVYELARSKRKPVTLGPDDVVFLPETNLLRRSYYDPAKMFIFNQNGFYLADILADPSVDSSDIEGVVSTSVLSDEYAKALNMPNCGAVSYVLDRERLAFQPKKKRQIAYMPRKRGQEAKAIVHALERRGHLDGFQFVAIDGVTKEEAMRIMRESLILISLSEREGFGLPPAEAMATGALVVGYTGHGGAEFFTPDTGVVVEDGDVLGVIEGVERVIAEYGRDPGAVLAKGEATSAYMLERYSLEAASRSFAAVMAEIEAHLAGDA